MNKNDKILDNIFGDFLYDIPNTISLSDNSDNSDRINEVSILNNGLDGVLIFMICCILFVSNQYFLHTSLSMFVSLCFYVMTILYLICYYIKLILYLILILICINNIYCICLFILYCMNCVSKLGHHIVMKLYWRCG